MTFPGAIAGKLCAVAQDVSDGNHPFLALVAAAEPCVQKVDAQLFVGYADTGAKPVLLRCADGKSYWCKWPDNPHGNLSLFHELMVGCVGRALNAPVRPIMLVRVSPDLVEGLRIDGQEVRGGTFIGSELLPHSDESTEIDRVGQDGNRERYARLLALFDLCLGDDMQLLHDLDEDQAVWSIDHGLWFWSTASDWTPESLASLVDVNGGWDPRIAGLSPAALLETAILIDQLEAEYLAAVCATLPAEWGIGGDAQVALAQLVLARRTVVSGRLRALSSVYARSKRPAKGGE